MDMGSQQELVSDGTLTTLFISMKYFSRSEITVFYDNVPVPPEDGRWSWEGQYSTIINFTPAVANGVTIKAIRSTDAGDPHHKFALGAQFNPKNLDENFEQVLRVVQEQREETVQASFFGNLNMHGFRVENLADATLPGHALTKRQFDLQPGAAAIFTTLLLQTGSTLIGFIQAGIGAVFRTVQDKLRESISVKDFGAKGDGVTDDTVAILKAKAHAILYGPMTVRFPKGVYLYTNIGNWAYPGLSLAGDGHRSTILKCTTSVAAFTVDAFQPGFTANDATAQFIQGCSWRNVTFQGVDAAAKIVDLRGVARSSMDNVWARNAHAGAGIAINMAGVMLSTFYNIGCSTDLDTMASRPYEGLRMESGTRAGVNIGNCSNNSMYNPYFEGLGIGMRLSGADNCVFICGSAEGNQVYDLLVGAACRYNSFIGMGFESTDPMCVNIADAGIYSNYSRCYANKHVILAGRGCEIRGGYYQKVEVQGGALSNRVFDITLYHWESSFPGTGGFFNSGTGTLRGRLWHAGTNSYINEQESRTGISVGSSPFTWMNNTGYFTEVVMQSGTITQVRHLRDTDAWLKPTTMPNSVLLAPGDGIEVSYSVAPGMSHAALCGLG